MAEPKEPKAKSKLVEIEEKTLAYWREKAVFEQTLAKDAPKGEFVFYDGPPFATGTPHYGHILASAIKDAIGRYKTMQGYHVPRRWGWDCHGLPVENLVEKELGLKTKKDIELYGVEKFNDAARESVLRYADEWRKQIPRIGRFVDMENDYRTMDAGFTESVWWVFKTLFDKGLIYEGFKSMHICPRCETSLSNFEVNQGYKDITDISVYVKFELTDESGTYFLAWTTTPWTLPGNVALAVGTDMAYVKAEWEGKNYIISKDLSTAVFKDKSPKILAEMKGSELVGKKYKPVFPYYDNEGLKNRENGFKVYAAPFVTAEDGTGIVHIAPAFGEDDMNLGRENSLPFIQHVGMDGKFRAEVRDFAGQEVKPKDDHQKADVEVIRYLAHNGFLFEKKKIIHSYPHCWRCDTPLLNYATSSWFVRVSEFRDKLVRANKKVSWVPEDIRDGRFGKWLLGARDWAISRSRYWGAPLPVWKGVSSGKLYAVGGLSDLKKLIKPSGNSYILMRHGESEANVRGVSNSVITNVYHLTKKGREEVFAQAEILAKKGVDVIIASDFVRTKETAKIVAEACGIDENQIHYDVRLREFQVGPEREGRSWRETEAHVRATGKTYPGMEQPGDVKKRAFSALYDIDKRYSGKKVLIVAHGAILNTLLAGLESEPSDSKLFHDARRHFKKTAEMHEMEFVRLPHNKDFDLDLHRPFIDRVECVAPDGEMLVRVPEVFDCWFESGSMPYGEACYTGAATENFDPKGGLFKKKRGFPADFIAEGLDQTRGWFYSMLVLGVALFGESPFKNVIVNGIVLAEDGEKMSKRLQNYPDPMDLVSRYGSDSLRYYLLSSPVVAAQDLKFSEKGVDEVAKKLFQRLDNVLAFYEMYADKGSEKTTRSSSALDIWIENRLAETASEMTAALDSYELDRAARPLMPLVDDLSTWYLRRSRDRFKSDDTADREAALSTTRRTLCGIAKLLAPFSPFFAEYLYARVRHSDDPESVHLAAWPQTQKFDEKAIQTMAEVRALVTIGLEQRAKANIKVRQPLLSATVRKQLSSEHSALLRDELNVKTVIHGSGELDIALDTALTKELKDEGVIRDLIRAIQEMRKKDGLTVGDKVELMLDSDEKGKELVQAYLPEIRRVTLVTGVSYAHIPDGEKLTIEEHSFGIRLRK